MGCFTHIFFSNVHLYTWGRWSNSMGWNIESSNFCFWYLWQIQRWSDGIGTDVDEPQPFSIYHICLHLSKHWVNGKPPYLALFRLGVFVIALNLLWDLDPLVVRWAVFWREKWWNITKHTDQFQLFLCLAPFKQGFLLLRLNICFQESHTMKYLLYSLIVDTH